METYKKIINVLEAFAADHLQVKGFGTGDPWEIEGDDSLKFPLLWVAPQASSLSIGNKELVYNFAVSIFDRLKEDKSNFTQVLSDTLDVLVDLASYLQRPEFNDILTVADPSRLDPFSEGLQAFTAGWVLTLQIRADYVSDTCNPPII